MKKLFALTVAVGLVLTASMVRAEGMAMAKEEAADVVEVVNKICPVSGEKIGDMGKGEVVEYKGKKYTLCCGMCKKDFDNDPDMYVKKVEEEMAASATENN